MRKSFLWALLMLAMGLWMIPLSAKAATATVRQTKFKKTSITVAWDDMTSQVVKKGNDPTIYAYQVVWYNDDGVELGRSKSLSPRTRKYKIKNLNETSVYQVRLRFGCYFDGDKTASKTYAISNLRCYTMPGVTEIQKYDYGKDQKGLRVRWEAAGGDNDEVRYQYQIFDFRNKLLKKGVISSNILNIKAFSGYNRVGKIRVREYILDNNDKAHYGAWSSYANIVPQPYMAMNGSRHGIQSNGTMILRWARVFGATEYEVYVSAVSKSRGYKKIGYRTANTADYMTVLVPSNNGRSFQKGMTYYVRVITKAGDWGESNGSYVMSVRRKIID